MKKEHFLLFIAAIVVVTALILKIIQLGNNNEPVPVVNQTASSSLPLEAEVVVEPDSEDIDNTETAEVVVSEPLPGDLVVSPLTVIGRARGGWFFEASLPVSLVDEDGDVIVNHYGQAESDWMTADFVPFRSELIFTTEANTGYLVIAKDNPSGLPENDDKIMIPVKFK